MAESYASVYKFLYVFINGWTLRLIPFLDYYEQSYSYTKHASADGS